MKRIFTFILSLILLVSLAIPASAAIISPSFKSLPSTVSPSTAKAQTFTYRDKNNNTKLSVPTEWDLEYEDYSQVEFISSSNAAPQMQYIAIDYYAETLSAEKQKKISRFDINNDMFSRSEIAEMLECKSSEVKLVTVNGQEYFRSETVNSYEYNDLIFSIDVTYWVHIENGWLYLYIYAGNHSASEYNKFKTLLGSAVYSRTSEQQKSDITSNTSDSTTYSNAVEAYEDGCYLEAQELFERIPTYKDSNKYLRLIRIRNAGSNPGVGSKVYQKACGLTSSDKKDIDAAAKDFYFADTAEVLLCNSDVASYYLIGDWQGGARCYITFIKNDYGCRYNIGSKLSTNYQSTFSIINGEVRVDVTGTNTLIMQLTLTAPDCMEVLTYEKNCKTYTLNRK